MQLSPQGGLHAQLRIPPATELRAYGYGTREPRERSFFRGQKGFLTPVSFCTRFGPKDCAGNKLPALLLKIAPATSCRPYY